MGSSIISSRRVSHNISLLPQGSKSHLVNAVSAMPHQVINLLRPLYRAAYTFKAEAHSVGSAIPRSLWNEEKCVVSCGVRPIDINILTLPNNNSQGSYSYDNRMQCWETWILMTLAIR